MQTKDFLTRIDFVISKGSIALGHKKYSDMGSDYVESGQYAGFRSSALSIISSIFGETHTYFREFDRQVNNSYVYNIEV